MHPSPVEADPRWTAILTRDPGADFVFSVRTTGIYCRPSCPAKRARPENVGFHPGPAEAEEAGFRPCRRCRPDAPEAPNHAEAIAAACRRIEAAEEPPSLGQLAAEACLSPHHFHRLFKAATGLTPRAYAAGVRAKRLREVLPSSSSVTNALFAAGFNAPSRFYDGAERTLGMSPSAFRAGAKGEAIRFALGQTTLGAVLVAATDKGLCAILLGDEPDALLRDLEDRFPHAHLVGGDVAFEVFVARVVGSVEEPRRGLDLPLDLRGSAFQLRVWDALRRIPPGEVANYSAIAAAIGAPGASRAVARACGANPIALAVPCHRVVPRGGGPGGYRWGVARKEALLARERRSS